MKKIDNMTVTTTYHVELKGVEVPDNVYKALKEYDGFNTYDYDEYDIPADYRKALDWLADHVKEDDADEVNYEVDID